METKRLLLFLFGCMALRYTVTYLAYRQYNLKALGTLALIAGIGILTIWYFNLRKTGAEVGGQLIWWDHLRPVHGAMWILFSYMALNNNKEAWKVLFADTTFGLLAWLTFHFNVNDFQVQSQAFPSAVFGRSIQLQQPDLISYFVKSYAVSYDY